MSQNEQLIKIFEYALSQEYTGKSFFETSLQRMGIGAAVTAFKSLIKEEERHIRLITRILKGLREKGEMELPEKGELTFEKADYFKRRSKSEFLEQCLEGSMVPEVTLFNTAWLIEKDLSEFYERMAGQTTGKAKRALTFLARWERGHEKFFRTYRDRFSDAYSKMAWGG